MFVEMPRRESLLQAGAVGVDWGAAGGLPGGGLGLVTGYDAKCFCLSGDKFGKVA